MGGVIGESIESVGGARGGCEPTVDVANSGLHVGAGLDAREIRDVDSAADCGVGVAGGEYAGRVASGLETAVLRTQAKQALVGMGWKPAVAAPAVATAAAALGTDAMLEELIFEALRRCPRPASQAC